MLFKYSNIYYLCYIVNGTVQTIKINTTFISLMQLRRHTREGH